MIPIVFFEDKDSHWAVQICECVPIPKEISVYGALERVDWHERWNALGDLLAEEKGLDCITIKTRDDFNAALDWCRTYGGRAICFCDYDLNPDQLSGGVVITIDDITQVGEVAFALANTQDATDVACFFNSGAQGLLLAAALVANKDADVDIWLASGVAVNVDRHVDTLKRFARRGCFVGKATDTITAAQVADRAVESVRIAVKAYSDQRILTDPGFWPEAANDWFASGRTLSPAPHNHSNFDAAAEFEQPENLVKYLQNLGATIEIARSWLLQEGCYETLKHFLGRCAVAQTGNRPLTLGGLVLPLLKATGGGQWARTFEWQLCVNGICEGNRSHARRLILTAFKLFERLTQARKKGASAHEVKAKFEKKTDGTHLLIDISFDCSVGDAIGKPSLAAKSLTFAWKQTDSDVSSALYDLLKVATGSNGGQKLFVSLYPVLDGSSTWTRLDFKASS